MSLSIKASSGGAMPGLAGSRGDPGIFGFLGKLAKGAVGSVPIVGPAISAVVNRPRSARPGIPAGPIPGFTPGEPAILSQLRHNQRAAVSAPQAAMNGMGCPKGHHPNKSDYFLRDGTFVPAGTRCVKNRRRNPLNPRAASRAISRIVSAKKATASLGRVTVRKKKC